jgi:hypothetical protein
MTMHIIKPAYTAYDPGGNAEGVEHSMLQFLGRTKKSMLSIVVWPMEYHGKAELLKELDQLIADLYGRWYENSSFQQPGSSRDTRPPEDLAITERYKALIIKIYGGTFREEQGWLILE